MFNSVLTKKVFQPDTINVLFLLWLLTLPFGAHVASVPIGFLTIYPNLIFTGILFILGIFTFNKWSNLAKISIAFLVTWTILTSFMSYRSGLSSEALFDIRSLIMQILFFGSLIGSYYIIGVERFNKSMTIGLRAFLACLVVSGIIEFLTGNHFAGTTTDKFAHLQIGNFFYSPLFVYDNPNDYLCYAIFILLLLITFDVSFRSKPVLISLFLILIYFFSQYADARIGKLISGVLLIVNLGILIYQRQKSTKVKQMLPYTLTAVLFGVLLFSKPIFYGPKYDAVPDYSLNEVYFYKQQGGKLITTKIKDSLTVPELTLLISQLDSIRITNPDQSKFVRKNLILNGLDFIKEQPVFGIGAGNYRKRHIEGKALRYTSTVTSAHNLPIELISQYGIFGWFYFLLLGIIMVLILKKWRLLLKENRFWLVLFFLSIPLLWMMPSAYLYLDIHWMFLPLILLKLDKLNQHSLKDVSK